MTGLIWSLLTLLYNYITGFFPMAPWAVGKKPTNLRKKYKMKTVTGGKHNGT